MILLTGATGFIGGHLLRRLLRGGHRVKCLVRSPATAALPEGAEAAGGDILDPTSLEAAMEGVEAVIHLVGIIREARGATFERIHAEGTRNVVEAARRAGVGRLLQMSALGSGPQAQSRYHKSKWAGEEAVASSGIPFAVFRPSIVCGRGDEFVNMFAGMIQGPMPFFPIVGSGQNRMQPVAVEDVAEAFVRAIEVDSYLGGRYELGGPEALTFEAMMRTLMEVLGRRKPVVHLPVGLFAALARILPNPPVTTDQLIMLGSDNVCSRNALPEVFGIDPKPYRETIASYVGNGEQGTGNRERGTGNRHRE